MEDYIRNNPLEIIYYGSPNTLVHLKEVNGKAFPYYSDLFTNELSNEGIFTNLIYKYPLKHLGPDYAKLYIIAIPSNDIKYKTPENEIKEKKCLIKCKGIKENKHNNHDYIVGFQSGIRSAVIRNFENGKYYRLKGCGNLTEGFISRDILFPKEGEEIRGCQFRHTSFREVFMSDQINSIFLEYGYEVCNKPIEVMLYNKDFQNQTDDLKNAKPFIDKMCSVYEIISEKRYGAHLLPGIETILAEVIKGYINKENNRTDYKETLIDLFPLIRKNERKIGDTEEKEIIEINPTSDYVPLIELNREEGDNLASLFSKYKIYSNIDENLTNVFDLLRNKNENKILQEFANINNIKEVFKKLLTKPLNVFDNSKLLSAINNKFDNLVCSIEQNKFSFLELIAIIFSRSAWECGQMKRIMQDKDVNWGTYEDQPYRLHCNAHSDNFVVYPKDKSKNKNLLCITDFDLSFFRKNFINIQNDDNPLLYAKPDDFLFDFYLNIERQHLEWEIAGLENAIVLDVIYKEEMSKDKVFDFTLKGFFNLMRDIAVIYYRKGYLLQEFDLKEKYLQFYDEIYDIIDISLLITHDLIG